MDGQTSGPSVDIRRYYESRMPADSDSVVSNHEHLRAPMYEPKPKSPGQDGFNPCAFASCLCHGTCNLRIGCYVIGGILLASSHSAQNKNIWGLLCSNKVFCFRAPMLSSFCILTLSRTFTVATTLIQRR